MRSDWLLRQYQDLGGSQREDMGVVTKWTVWPENEKHVKTCIRCGHHWCRHETHHHGPCLCVWCAEMPRMP